MQRKRLESDDKEIGVVPPVGPSPRSGPKRKPWLRLLPRKVWVGLALFAVFIIGSSVFGWREKGRTVSSKGKFGPPFGGPFKTSLDRVYFGIGSSSKTVDRVAKYGSLWLKNDVRYTVLVDEMPEDADPVVKEHIRVSSCTKHDWWYRTKMDFHTRLAWSIWDLFDQGLTDVDWFIVTDDDGMWFIDGLLEVLSKYDPLGLWYLGNWSEDFQQVLIHGHMAYGGGGYAISYPLAKMLYDTMAECLPRYNDVYGQDGRVFGCVSELGVRLTREEGFHQMDLTGDVRGLLEAHPQAPLCSLHHLQQVDPVFPHLSNMHGLHKLMDASVAHGTNFMQQWVASNRVNTWTFSLAQGYSLKWWERSKLVTWVQSTEITFDRYLKKPHHGPQDWDFTTRRGLRPCRHHDAFYWTGLANDGERQMYVRSSNPRCISFPHVQMIYVTQLPGTANGYTCEVPSNSAELSPELEITLCGTYQSFKFELSGSSVEREGDNSEVKKAIYSNIMAGLVKQKTQQEKSAQGVSY